MDSINKKILQTRTQSFPCLGFERISGGPSDSEREFINPSIYFGDLQTQTVARHTSKQRAYIVSTNIEQLHHTTKLLFSLPTFTPNPPRLSQDSLEADLAEALDVQCSVGSEYLVCEAHLEQQRYPLGLPSAPLCTSPSLLSTVQHYPGVHSTYAYVSREQSFTPFHREDFNLQSVNHLHTGYAKVWCIVHPRHTELLESQIANLFRIKVAPCHQFIRHENVIIPPSVLRAWNVEFSLVAQYPGDTMLTDYNTYHYVWNTGPNLAEAVNLCETGWLPPVTYRVCSDECGGGDYGFRTIDGMKPGRLKQLNVQAHHVPVMGTVTNKTLESYVANTPNHSSAQSHSSTPSVVASPIQDSDHDEDHDEEDRDEEDRDEEDRDEEDRDEEDRDEEDRDEEDRDEEDRDEEDSFMASSPIHGLHHDEEDHDEEDHDEEDHDEEDHDEEDHDEEDHDEENSSMASSPSQIPDHNEEDHIDEHNDSQEPVSSADVAPLANTTFGLLSTYANDSRTGHEIELQYLHTLLSDGESSYLAYNVISAHPPLMTPALRWIAGKADASERIKCAGLKCILQIMTRDRPRTFVEDRHSIFHMKSDWDMILIPYIDHEQRLIVLIIESGHNTVAQFGSFGPDDTLLPELGRYFSRQFDPQFHGQPSVESPGPGELEVSTVAMVERYLSESDIYLPTQTIPLRCHYLELLLQPIRASLNRERNIENIRKRKLALTPGQPSMSSSFYLDSDPSTELKEEFASPRVFADICIILKNQQTRAFENRQSVISKIMLVVTQAEAQVCFRQWEIDYGAMYLYEEYIRQLQVVRGHVYQISLERQRERQRSKGKRHANLKAETITWYTLVQSWMNPFQQLDLRSICRELKEKARLVDEQQKRMINVLQKKSDRGKELFDLAGILGFDPKEQPLWVLFPTSLRRRYLDLSPHERMSFWRYLETQRSRLFAQLPKLARGLRAVVGLDESLELPIYRMDPQELLAQAPDSDILLNCLLPIDETI